MNFFAEDECRSNMLKVHLNDMFPGCLQTYSRVDEDRTPFHLRKWIPIRNYSHVTSVNDICPKPWRYQSATKLNTFSHEAVAINYDGGGYVADLGYNEESASQVVGDLRSYNWVDERTAAVFIEFTLFDPSSSLFCNVRNVYERLATGQVLTAVDARVLSLYPSTDVNFHLFYEVCQLLFLIVIVAFFIVEMIKFFRQKRYLFQVWNWIQLVLLVVSLVAVVMSLLKEKHTSLYVKDIKRNPYETFSSDSIARLLDIETFWLSMAIFILTLKLLKLIRFNHHICQMQGTLKRSAMPILSFSLVMVIAILAFTHFGFLCFGATLATFSSFFKALRVVLLMSIGKSINNVAVHVQFPVLGPLFLFFFLVVIVFVLINVFVAVLVDAYSEIREEQEAGGFVDAELGMFMYNVLLQKIRKFSGKIATAKKRLYNNILSRTSKGNDPYSSGDSFVESWCDESLDNIDLAMFEPSNDIKGSRPIFQPHCPQEWLSDNNVSDVANFEELAKESSQFSDKKSSFTDPSTYTKAAMRPRCPQECFDVGTTDNATDFEESLNEDDVLIYIQNRFMEMLVEVLSISSSEGLKAVNRG